MVLINDDFVPFIKEKFSLLKLVLILNERQKEILLNGKFINSDKIIKSTSEHILKIFVILAKITRKKFLL